LESVRLGKLVFTTRGSVWLRTAMRTITAATGVVITSLISIFAGAPPGTRAGDLAFSDPATLPPPPPHAVGFPSRAPDLDALPGFRKPPPRRSHRYLTT
jgi:hypothetical protein